MSELPGRPDLNQLRRQARELLRAAIAGDPQALARLRAVSARVTLSAAQLALAREYGFPSWPALRTEADRRRSLYRQPPDREQAGQACPPAMDRWSFGGGTAIDTAAGVLHPGVLIAGTDHAELHAVLLPSGGPRRRRAGLGRKGQARAMADYMNSLGRELAGDLTVADDQAMRYAVRPEMMSGLSAGPVFLRLGLDPVPLRGLRWLDLGSQQRPATRLEASGRPVVRVSQPAPLPVGPAEGELGAEPPPALGSDLAAEPMTGLRQYLDIAAVLPPLDGTVVRVDQLASEPESWHLYLRANPDWWIYSADRRAKRAAMSVRAQDDLGGEYASNFGGSARHGGQDEVALDFLPRLDPRAGAVTVTFAGTDEQVTMEVRVA
jgi:hypothetical protein